MRWKTVRASTRLRLAVVKVMPARWNSAVSMGTSKRRMPKPARSASPMKSSSLGARAAKPGWPRTISSVMWWTAVASGGMGIPGFTSEEKTSSWPSGERRRKARSTMRSRSGATPVVSRSKKTTGLRSLIMGS